MRRSVALSLIIAAALAVVMAASSPASADGCDYNDAIAGVNCVEVVEVDELPAGTIGQPHHYTHPDTGLVHAASCAVISQWQILCVVGPVIAPADIPAQYVDTAGNICRNIKNVDGQVVDIVCTAPVSVPVPAFTG